MGYGKEIVLCIKDNFEKVANKRAPKFGELYEVTVDMGQLLQLKGFGESLFPVDKFEDITNKYNELTDILLDNNIAWK